MQKKILITFLFKEGAGPIFTLEMARGLVRNNCEVHALLSSKIANRRDWEDEKVFKTVTFIDTGTRETAIKTTLGFFLKGKHVLKRQFQQLNFDYAVSTFFHPWASSILGCFNVRKKIIICHDPIYHSGVGLLERWMTTRYLKTADDIVVLTRSFIPIVEKKYGYDKKHIHYMPHGRMSLYKRKSSNNIESSNSVNFLFFGRIGEYKGLHILAKAYGRLCQSYSNVTLTVAGSGNFDKYKSAFANIPNVRIENRYIGDDEIDDFFSIPNTVVVLPYLDASQSGVIPIALEYKTPIIASDTGGLREQLDNGGIGLFCKAGDADSLMVRMEYIMNTPDYFIIERDKMEDYLQCLEWDVVTKQIIQI